MPPAPQNQFSFYRVQNPDYHMNNMESCEQPYLMVAWTVRN